MAERKEAEEAAVRATWTFGRLLEWHLRVNGTRPEGVPGRKGLLWPYTKFADSVGTTSRNVRYWRDRAVPSIDTLNAIEEVLFGDKPAYDIWREELRAAARRLGSTTSQLPNGANKAAASVQGLNRRGPVGNASSARDRPLVVARGRVQKVTSPESESGEPLFAPYSPPLRTLSALKAHLEEQQYNMMGYRIAVEALIFDQKGRLLLQERGPECRDEVGNLECLGGQVFGEDLVECTVSRVRGLVGQDVQIELDELLDVQPARFVERHGPEDWIVVAHLCRLVEGTPSALNPGKTAGLKWLTLPELHAIDDSKLSRSTSRQRDLYRVKFRTNPYFSRPGWQK